MAQPISDPRPTRRQFWLRPRFSLFAALLTITLCALGLWYWYRVPFEVRTEVDARRVEVESRRRTWDGYLRHGEKRIYVNDKLHFVENYRDRIPHGTWEWRDSAGRVCQSADFASGRLTAFRASERCDKRLAKLLSVGTLTDPRITRELLLTRPGEMEFKEIPLRQLLGTLRDMYDLPMIWIDLLKATERRPGNTGVVSLADVPITCDAEAPLIEVLGQALQPHDLVCDYRYGMLWIADRQEAEVWRDPTGIDRIVPPAGTRLAKNWESNSAAEFVETPLRAAFEIALRNHVPNAEFDWSQVSPERQAGGLPGSAITLNVEHIPLKHVLGAVLEQSGCRARLNGETLVIEPPPVVP